MPRPVEHRIEVGDAWPAIGDDDFEPLGRRLAAKAELDPAPAGIFERVARDLRDRSGDPRLILRFEADQLGEPAGALAHQHDVGLGRERQDQQAGVHEARIAATVASSRPRRWSRNNTPAISEGWLAASPG